MNKKRWIILCSGILIIVVIIAVAFILQKQSGELPIEAETTTDINVEIPTEIPTTEPITTDDEISEHGITPDITVDVSGQDNEQGNKESTSKNPAKEPDKPIEQVKPTQSESSGIHIGDGDKKPEKYSCGSPNHKCKNAEAHAYILNLELEGCPYCGSHSCPSFYGTDKWGNTGLFVELCPQYNKKHDPAKYCPKCGKKTGDGGNGTCASFIHDDTCPFCGQFVKANTCHSH